MGIRVISGMFQQILRVGCKKKQEISGQSSKINNINVDVPKGHFAVYVEEEEKKKKKRFVVPIWYLKHPMFQELLSRSEEKYGFEHPMGNLVIPCAIDDFVALTSRFNHC